LERALLERTDARLFSAETDPNASVKIDSEGSAKATAPKSRLLAPAISALVALKSMDNDNGKPTSAGGNGAGNSGGKSLGGFSGFGLLGSRGRPRIGHRWLSARHVGLGCVDL
jgi:hypothetical protein